MRSAIKSKLELLRYDFNKITGNSFKYFFCPILYCDEETQLCRGHIINQAFPNSPFNWTIQRKDIDNFFGSVFEADFLAIRFYEDHSIEKIFLDKSLSKQFNPQILLNDKPVDYFFFNQEFPNQFPSLLIEHGNEKIRLGLKMPSEEISSTLNQNWEFTISKDIRIQAMVSLIKAAHLSLFELLGYSYVLSYGGTFVGYHILGKFFLQNYCKEKSVALKNAYPFFRKFANMVRPLQMDSFNLQGTISDQLLLLCGKQKSPWAIVVFIKTSTVLNAVLIPMFSTTDTVEKYIKFLKDENENIEATLCCFEQGQWKVNRESFNMIWPKTGIQYPE